MSETVRIGHRRLRAEVVDRQLAAYAGELDVLTDPVLRGTDAERRQAVAAVEELRRRFDRDFGREPPLFDTPHVPRVSRVVIDYRPLNDGGDARAIERLLADLDVEVARLNDVQRCRRRGTGVASKPISRLIRELRRRGVRVRIKTVEAREADREGSAALRPRSEAVHRNAADRAAAPAAVSDEWRERCARLMEKAREQEVQAIERREPHLSVPEQRDDRPR